MAHDLRAAAQQALEALDQYVFEEGATRSAEKAVAALRAALSDGDNLSPTGCDHCRHPLYAAIKCNNCGRVTARAEDRTDWSAA